MATNFDDLVDSVTTEAPSAPPVPATASQSSFDSLVDQVTTPDTLHASLFAAQTANPAEAVKRKNEGRQLGVASTLITPDSVARIRQQQNDPQAIAATSPGTAQFLSKPDNAAIAVDGVKSLQGVEATAQGYRAVPIDEQLKAKRASYNPDNIKRFIDEYTATGLSPAEAAQRLSQYKAQGLDLNDVLNGDTTPKGLDMSTVQNPVEAAAGAKRFAQTQADKLERSQTNPALSLLTDFTKQIIPGVGRAIGGAIRGQDTSAPTNFVDMTAQDWITLADSISERALASGADPTFLSAGQSTGYFLATILPAAIGGPAGWATAFGMMYRGQQNQFAGDLRQAFEQQNGPVSDTVWQSQMDQVQSEVVKTGLWEAVPEVASDAVFFKLIKGVVGEKALGALMGKALSAIPLNFANESLSEMLTNMGEGNAMSDAMAKLGIKNAPPRSSWLNPADYWENYKQVAPAIAVQSAFMLGAGGAVGLAAHKLNSFAAGVATSQAEAPFVETQKAVQAQSAYETLTALTKKAEQDSTRQLDAPTFHEFVQTMVEENQTLQDVYVDASTLSEALGAAKIDVAELQSKMPEVASQLQEGLATGGQVRISLPDYLTYIAPTSAAETLLPHLRAEADGLSYQEAQAFYQEQTKVDEAAIAKMKEEAQPVLSREEFHAQQAMQIVQEATPVEKAAIKEIGPDEFNKIVEAVGSDPQAVKEIDQLVEAAANNPQAYEDYLANHPNQKAVLARDTNDVHNQILSDLQNTGRFPRAFNAAYAVPFREFYAQNAKRMGIRPSQLYNRVPLKFVAEAMNLGSIFEQPEQVAGLGDFAPGKVRDILSKFGWAIMTAENPANAKSTPEENAAYMEKLRAYLDDNEIQYENVQGKYDREENSVLLFGVTAKQALDMGRLFNQESVLTRDGLVYQDGGINPTTGNVTEFTEEPENHFTRIPSLGTTFSVGIDFNTLLQPGDRQEIAMEPDLQVRYTGHGAKTGGLQGHSVGAEYPYMVVGREAPDNGGLRWQAMNMSTGATGPLRNAYAESAADIADMKSGTFKQTVEGGKVGEVSIIGVHFSREQRTLLSGNYYGRGAKGAEADRVFSSKDGRLRQRLHFYVDEGKGVFPEAGVGNFKHTVRLDNMYDAARNPQKFPKRDKNGDFDYNVFEAAVIDAGFNGYYVEAGFHRQGVAVMMGEPSTRVIVSDTVAPASKFYQAPQGWYYSQLSRTIAEAKTGSQPAAQWKAWITANAPKFGIKKDEIQWTGISEWLDLQEGKVSRQQIADYLNQNGVQVEETTLGKTYIKDYIDSGATTKFSSYVLPGGENYRELLLTLPNSETKMEDSPEHLAFKAASDDFLLAELNGASQVELLRLQRAQDEAGAAFDKKKADIRARTFRSTHFDQPNILAHVRFNERADSGGNRVLFVEEIQSDWGQMGKKEGFGPQFGYRVTEPSGQLFGEYRTRETAEQALSRAKPGSVVEKSDVSYGGVPSAPFVTDTKAWTGLAMKRMIAYAVDNGFDKIAWTTGEQQAERYDLSKTIQSVAYRAETQRLTAYDLSDKKVFDDTVAPDKLADVIGKDAAENLLAKTPDAFGEQELNGVELKVGGEGMKGFYDKIVPSVANDVLKKIGGGKVGGVALRGDPPAVETRGASRYVVTVEGERHTFSNLEYAQEYLGKFGIQSTAQPGFTITEDMKAKVRDGLPLFQNNLGSFDPNSLTVALLNGANLSTVLHEGGHFYLRALELMANMPEATPEIRDDYAKVLNWFGVTQQQWESMSVDQQRPYHEQWAQSQERWMLEGKAPTVEMQPIFARFRSWMLDIYKSVEQFLARNPLAGKLDDEIRGVFSRLIASEEAINQAETLRGYSALPLTEGTPAGEYADYLKQHKQATEDAVDTLQQRSIRDMKWATNARSKVVREMQRLAASTRKQVKAGVAKQVMAEPINQARDFLRTGEMTDPNSGDQIKIVKGYKLSTEALATMYPENALGNPDLTKLRGMVAKDGLDPDMVAKMFGLDSGDRLVRELIGGEKPADKIEGLTDQRMLEEHGDLIDQRAIESAADEAVHNEARARFMATGLRMLTHSPISSTQLAKAAKQAADNAISAKKVRDLRPAQYTAAEARALKEALKLAPTKPTEAADAQRSALLNNRMAQASYAAQAEVKKLLKYVSKFKNEGTRKNLDLEYLEQIDQLLAAFDPSPSTTLKQIAARQSLSAWVAQQEEMGYQPTLDPEVLADMKRTSYKEMTVEELRGFVDAIKEIEHLGRLKQKLLTALDKRAFQERMAEADASIRANANRTVPERGSPSDAVGHIAKFGRWFAANHRKFASFMREMDGGHDNGVMWNLFARGMNAAGTKETVMKSEGGEALAKLFAPIQKALSRTITPGNFYARKTVVPGTQISMTTEQRLMFAMNWGNEGNRQRLLDGGITGHRALTQSESQAILDTLTKEQWDFVQGIWDYIATYKPQIEAQERELTGKTPAWVDPTPILTRFGTYAGGYFPAKYDVALSTRSESLEAATNLRLGMKGAFNSAATRNGYTKARSEAVKNRPLLLSFNAITQHVNEVSHRLAWQAWLIDANRSIRGLDSVIREHYGVEVLNELQNTVRDIAQGVAPATNPLEVFINRVRSGSTIVGLAWRFSTAAIQVSGLSQSWSRIGGRWAAQGVKEYVAAPVDTTAWVLKHSQFMAHRMDTMSREIGEILNTVRAGEKLSAVQGSFFYAIGKMQQVVDIPTWVGAYEKSLSEQRYELAPDQESRNKMEATAVAVADQAVRDSQSGGELHDLAGIQRGGPLQKLFTNFYSYFSATYNLNVEAYRRTDFKSPSEIGAFAADMILLNIIPVVFSTALALATKGQCEFDDPECIAGQYAHQELGYLTSQMVLLREIGAAIDVAVGGPQYGYSGPAGLRFFADVYKAAVQAQQGDADLPLFKALNSTLGALLHYPAGQVNTTVEGIMAIENGEVEGWGVVPALMFGPPK